MSKGMSQHVVTASVAMRLQMHVGLRFDGLAAHFYGTVAPACGTQKAAECPEKSACGTQKAAGSPEKAAWVL
jgi:hypothetical protein